MTETRSKRLANLWDNARAAAMSEPERLVYRSNLLGSDKRITNYGGGNTSAKVIEKDPLGVMLEPLARPITDAFCSLIAHGALDRHPNLRIVSVENGSDWVGNLFHRFNRAYGQMPKSFSRHPRETFIRQCFVAPSYEDDMNELARLMPAERILFGSDFPHPEGLAEPLDYLKEFTDFSEADVKRIFHSNLKGLIEGARD